MKTVNTLSKTGNNKLLVILLTAIIINLSFSGCVSEPQDKREKEEIEAIADSYYFGGHTYVYIKNKEDWQTARELCNDVGGCLLVVEDEKENTFISNILAEDTWLGLTDEEEEGNFRWINGAEFLFSNWQISEPNNWDGNQNYAHYKRAIAFKWNDTEPGGTHYDGNFFICEFDFKVTNLEKLTNVKNYLYGVINEKEVLENEIIEAMEKIDTSVEKQNNELSSSAPNTSITPLEEVNLDDLPLVAVFNFKIENMQEAEGMLIVDLMISELFSTKKYRVLERAQRDNILNEMQFSFSDISDESAQIEIGRLLAADLIIIGGIGKVGTRFVFNTKLIDVTTGVTISTAYNKYTSIDELVDGLEVLVRELCKN